ncbi:MAG: hypothetical protein JST75_21905 [Bacteroidetes bacterium]|nr:hypothetical protein [Bacteroidota bacterium]
MQTVIGVGFSIPSKEDDYLPFDQQGSLSDADVVIIDPSFESIDTCSTDYGNSNFQGKTLYDQNSSFKIKEHLTYWNNEIDLCIRAGKTVFITLSKKNDFFIHTGQKQTSGTGRNQKVNNVVEPCDNYKFLEIPKFNIFNATGSKIFPVSQLIKPLFECCQEYFNFEAYIETEINEKNLLLATKNKDKLLGVSLKRSNGHIVFIPAIDYPQSFTNREGEWSEEAIKFGKRLKACLVQLSDSLKEAFEKLPPPEWASYSLYDLASSENTKQLIKQNNEKLSAINQENLELGKVLDEHESIKDLLFETGKPLELAVIKALKLLDYSAENYNDGVLELDQVIVSPEGDRFIGECEGKDNKDIDISKFRQLSDSLNEDFAREEIQDKALGLLFGNAQRVIPPGERSLDFTEKCKRAAVREKIGLIKTSDLFFVAKFLMENIDKDYAKKCRDAIKSQLGGVIIFPTIPESKNGR